MIAQMNSKPTRLGLDIGTNSIGWWLYELDSDSSSAKIAAVLDGGVRIFSTSSRGAGRDPKSGASLAVDRRLARSMRRRRDRYLRRRAALMKKLSYAGLMPKDPDEAKALTVLDPYELRARGLDEKLPLTHFGRALFHLNQRRGFKSNRKTDRGDNESGKIKDATRRLDLEIDLEANPEKSGSKPRTYGEFLFRRRQNRPDKPAGEGKKENKDKSRKDDRRTPSVRTRLTVAVRGGPDAEEESGYDYYPDRRHLESEFCKLWEAQAEHHDILSSDLRDQVYEIIFFQRNLRKPQVGLCLFTAEERLPRAHPLAQRRVLYETVNQLRIASYGQPARPLRLEERDKLIHMLDNKKPTQTLSSMSMKLEKLGKTIHLRDGERFTLETGVRDEIACDPVRSSLSHPNRFGSRWSTLNWEDQWAIVSKVRDVQSEDDHEKLVEWLTQNYAHLDKDHAEAVANAPLPEGYSRLGETATTSILEQLKSEVITYAEAVAACGWDHWDQLQSAGECLERLPYYGEVLDRHVLPGTHDENHDEITRFGRITNPTVHIGLNQLRRLVNRIIQLHGKPSQIVVELARDLKKSAKEKQEEMKRIRDNTSEAKRRSENLQELGQRDTGRNRMLLRLWEELGPAVGPRRCPYSGEAISATMVFDGSCDVDHILPYSRTLDDSIANRTLCLREANRGKGNRSPWEAWGDSPKWDVIQANLKNLPKYKSWRFASDAMKRFEGEREFSDRALVDTRYLARISRTYLETLFVERGHVWVVPGRMTEMLRRHWGLNNLLNDKERGAEKSKNRTDHRHHAIDAAVVAATDRGLIQEISNAANQFELAGQSAEQITRDTSPPWEDFRRDVSIQLEKIIVSHRADHGRIDREARKSGSDSTTGKLHNETAYGIVDDDTVVSRTPLLSLGPGDIEFTTKGKNIRDLELQKALSSATRGKDGKEFENSLREFANRSGPYHGIRRVRMIESLQKSARVAVRAGPDRRPIKVYKGDSNHCYELWRLPNGRIVPQVVTTFEANAGVEKRPHPAAKRLLRVFKRDMVSLERDGHTMIGCVQKLDLAHGLFLAQHHEANVDARHRSKDDEFKMLQFGAGSIMKSKLRRVFVDEMGRLRDPGPIGERA